MAEVRLCCNNWRDQRKTEGTYWRLYQADYRDWGRYRGCVRTTIETGDRNGEVGGGIDVPGGHAEKAELGSEAVLM